MVLEMVCKKCLAMDLKTVKDQKRHVHFQCESASCKKYLYQLAFYWFPATLDKMARNLWV